MSEANSVEEVLELERRLQTAECRAEPECVGRLLADDFVEIGASVRVWDRVTIMETLARDVHGDNPIEVHELSGSILGDGIVATQWVSVHAGTRARRSSIWRRGRSGWRIVRHQGTPISEGAG